MRSYVNMHTYNWCVDKMYVCIWMVSAIISGHVVSLRPCTDAGHAGRLVERRKEEKRQRTRLLAVDRPPCSPEPLKSLPPTKAIRKILKFWILEQKYILSFSFLWFPAQFDILPLSPCLALCSPLLRHHPLLLETWGTACELKQAPAQVGETQHI